MVPVPHLSRLMDILKAMEENIKIKDKEIYMSYRGEHGKSSHGARTMQHVWRYMSLTYIH